LLKIGRISHDCIIALTISQRLIMNDKFEILQTGMMDDNTIREWGMNYILMGLLTGIHIYINCIYHCVRKPLSHHQGY